VRVSERRRQPGLGFTQAGLPEIMGVAPGRVSQIEHGEVSTVEALELSGCRAAWFAGFPGQATQDAQPRGQDHY
jgi:hypothetical protein